MTKSDMPSIPFRIASAREQKHLTQANLAQRLGVHAMTISKWERGDQIPRRPALLALGEVLGVSVRWLETGEGAVQDHEEPYSPDICLLASAILLVDRVTQAWHNPVPIEKRAVLIARVVTLCKDQGLRDAGELPVEELWRVG